MKWRIILAGSINFDKQFNFAHFRRPLSAYFTKINFDETFFCQTFSILFQFPTNGLNFPSFFLPT